MFFSNYTGEQQYLNRLLVVHTTQLKFIKFDPWYVNLNILKLSRVWFIENLEMNISRRWKRMKKGTTTFYLLNTFLQTKKRQITAIMRLNFSSFYMLWKVFLSKISIYPWFSKQLDSVSLKKKFIVQGGCDVCYSRCGQVCSVLALSCSIYRG